MTGAQSALAAWCGELGMAVGRDWHKLRASRRLKLGLRMRSASGALGGRNAVAKVHWNLGSAEVELEWALWSERAPAL